MTKDDILQALRLTAMGRCNHPLQEELADKLADVFAREVKPHVADFSNVPTLAEVMDAPKKRKKAD